MGQQRLQVSFKQTNVRKVIKFHASLGKIVVLQKRRASTPRGGGKGRRRIRVGGDDDDDDTCITKFSLLKGPNKNQVRFLSTTISIRCHNETLLHKHPRFPSFPET
jgi:hypothetical protein